MHRAKIAQPRVRMEGWRQWRPGSNGRNPQKGKEKKRKKRKKRKTHLTHTGLLMEGPSGLPRGKRTLPTCRIPLFRSNPFAFSVLVLRCSRKRVGHDRETRCFSHRGCLGSHSRLVFAVSVSRSF